MPLKPVTCGMQNTIHLLYKFLKEKKNKLIFYNINNSSVVDPVINLKFNKNIFKRINKLTLKYDFDTIFVNTSKLLNIYQNFFFKKKKQFKVFLICHDLYYFRKNFFKNINIKDKTVLTKENEIRSLKKVDHILDFSDLEKKFMIKNKIDKHKLLNTFTPTKKTYKIYDSSASYDLLYVASNWQQNNINLKFAQKTLKLNTNNFKLLILGNPKYQKIKNKNIVFKKYSSDNMKKAKLGLAIIKYQTGRQTKIFEMMSIGLPVVTNVNLSNYGLVNGTHYIFQKNQDKLIKVVTSLLKDKKKREKISSECFYWSKANTFYKNSFKQLIKLSI